MAGLTARSKVQADKKKRAGGKNQKHTHSTHSNPHQPQAAWPARNGLISPTAKKSEEKERPACTYVRARGVHGLLHKPEKSINKHNMFFLYWALKKTLGSYSARGST
jgi:hypothetical protein